MGAKLASRNTGMVKEEKPKLTDAQMVAEVRKLRAGKLFVGNMEYVDAVLRDRDSLVAAGDILANSTKEANLVIEEAIATIEELRGQLASERQQVIDLASALTEEQGRSAMLEKYITPESRAQVLPRAAGNEL